MRPYRAARQLRVVDPRVLVDLAEEVLAVDRLEAPSPQRLELESQPLELHLLTVDHQLDYRPVGQPGLVGEHLVDSVPGSGAGRGELALGEIGNRAVVHVGRVLVRQEVADSRVADQDAERSFHRFSLLQLSGDLLAHHPGNQLQVAPVLAPRLLGPGSGRHDVGGRVDGSPRRQPLLQCAIVCVDVEVGERRRSQCLFQRFPGLDLVEELEQQDAEEDLFRARRPAGLVDDVADQVLTYPVGGSVRVGELVLPQNRVVGPRRPCPGEPPEVDRLSARCEPPVGVVRR